MWDRETEFSGCCRRQISAATEGLSDDDSKTSSAAVLSCFSAQANFITDTHSNPNLEEWSWVLKIAWLQFSLCFSQSCAPDSARHSPVVGQQSHVVGCDLYLCPVWDACCSFKAQNKQTSICFLVVACKGVSGFSNGPHSVLFGSCCQSYWYNSNLVKNNVQHSVISAYICLALTLWKYDNVIPVAKKLLLNILFCTIFP